MTDKMQAKQETITPSIELGGRTWELRMTHSIMMQYSSITRVPMDQLENNVARYDFMILLLWLMLRGQDPQLKREKFDRWLDDLGVRGVLEKLVEPITQAFVAAFPAPEETEGEEDAADPT